MEQLPRKIGKNLYRIRKSRGLSLDKLAEITGVSKAMLGQMERGESNPTITTLWKISNGLRVSFSSLIEEQSPSVSVVSLQEISPLMEEAGEYKVYPLFPFDQEKKFEIFHIELAPRSSHFSDAHHPGVEEYVIVSDGTMEIEIDEEVYPIHKGNAIRFPADRPHIYRNPAPSQTRGYILIYYPT